MQREDTPTPSPDRRLSMSPTANSSACWSTTSLLTFATAMYKTTSGNLTCATECCAAASAGPALRMVSVAQRAIAAICYEAEPLDTSVRVVVQSELVANEGLPPQSKDPRVGAALESALEGEEYRAQGTVGLLVHHTRVSGLRIGAAMDHHVEGPPNMVVESESSPDVVS